MSMQSRELCLFRIVSSRLHPLSIMTSIAFLILYVSDYIDNHKYTKGDEQNTIFILLCDRMLLCMFQSEINTLFGDKYFIDI